MKPHEIFKIEGLNVISEVPLSLTEAILGCKITVDTLDGKISLEVQPGTNNGEEIALKHKGMPPFQPPDNYNLNELRGGHILRFKVMIPSNMNEQQRDIINEFKKTE